METLFEEIKKIEKNMATKKEVESLIDTIEIMGNSKTMKQILESNKDIERGKVKEINSASDLEPIRKPDNVAKR